MPAVSVEHLAKSYGDVLAVRDVSFEVARGEVFALLGPNGAGKTTIIEILEGFRSRSRGRGEHARRRSGRRREPSGGCGPGSGWCSRNWRSSPSTPCARC